MPCIEDDGEPTSSGTTVLAALQADALTPPVVSPRSGLPLFLVRSYLRELRTAGFVEEQDGRYALSAKDRPYV